MDQKTSGNSHSESSNPSKPSKKIMIINVVFFVFLFTGALLMPFSGLTLVIVLAVLVFFASILYTYLF